jgi:hypothetical protein
LLLVSLFACHWKRVYHKGHRVHGEKMRGRRSNARFYEDDFTPGRESVQLEFFMIFAG